MEKRSPLSPGFLPFRRFSLTSMRPATTPGSALWCTSTNIEQYSGEGRTGRRAPPTARSRVGPNCVSPRFEQRTSTHRVLWNAPWHSKEPELVSRGSRKIRELSLRRSVLHNFMCLTLLPSITTTERRGGDPPSLSSAPRANPKLWPVRLQCELLAVKAASGPTARRYPRKS
ncbi:hypothetical protein TcBrA4_0137670 [Trypanosoma cruzi]|nr:hypothetical protein TcBrA4_0137670 [Trypanosoma cruzi]